MAAFLAWLKALPIIDRIVGRAYLIWSEIKRARREQQDAEELRRRDEEHEQIRADPAAHARKRGWLRNDGRSESGAGPTRPDGTPKDFDVSGKGGQLDRE